ncbi:MAG: HPr family phosphocarrier protein [Clostridiales bacterium]|jgi:phosphocarrier protein|nr:HPr family phosphocarrier protein [Clostridiales bacterium]
MTTRRVTIINKSGLHARPASDFALKAKEFASKITIRNLDSNGAAVNTKSMLRILGESFSQGTNAEIAADGADEQQAVDSLATLIESGFGE